MRNDSDEIEVTENHGLFSLMFYETIRLTVHQREHLQQIAEKRQAEKSQETDVAD